MGGRDYQPRQGQVTPLCPCASRERGRLTTPPTCRDNIDELKEELKGLGADHVLTYSEFLTREARGQVKEWTAGGELRLALNCVGGKETTEMVKCLGMSGFLGEFLQSGVIGLERMLTGWRASQ